MLDLLEVYFSGLLDSFLDPRKRVSMGYLVCALLIGLAYWVWFRQPSLKGALAALFSNKIWLSLSAKADYKITLINQWLMLLLSPLLFSQLALATALFFWFYELFPARPLWLSHCSSFSISLIFTIGYFVLDDFARFYVHRLLHRWPLLWAFHKVHHSAQRLTPFTVFRTHPVESVIFSLRSVFTQGIAIGIFVFFLGDRADLVTVLGANVFVFVFNLLGSNLRHSHIPIRYWKPLEKVFISPAQHQIHHSLAQRHWEKNYGVTLAIWDWFFGSLHHSEPNQRLCFGLKGHKQHTLKALYFEPFIDTWKLLKQYTLHALQKLLCYVYDFVRRHLLRFGDFKNRINLFRRVH